MERRWSNQKLLLAGVYLLFVGVGCSLGPANDGTRIRVAIPEQYEIASQEGHGARSGAKGLSIMGRTHGRTTSETLTLTPATLADFDCYAVNVVASDIPVESRIPQCVGAPLSSKRRAGILGGMIAAGGGSIDLKVTAGTSRTFQLLGFKTTATSCLAVEDVLSKRVEMKTSQPYVLAETTLDIQSDATVRLKVEYDPLRPVNGMSDCTAPDSTGSEATHRLSFVRQTTGVAAGEALGSLQAPSVEILDSTGARVTSGALASTVLVLSLSGVSQSVASLQATAGVADFAGSGIVLTQAGSMRWGVGAISGSSISSTLSGSFVVTPGTPQLSTSSIESSSSSLLAGGSTAVTVRVRDQYGNAVTGATGSFGVLGTHPVSWYPSGVVSLGDQGSVSSSLSSTMAGSATPIFALSGLTLTLSPAISVIPGSIASVSVTPSTPSTIPFGQTVTMTARAYDSYSNLVTTLTSSASLVSIAKSSGGLPIPVDFDSVSSPVAPAASLSWTSGTTSLNGISILGAGDFRFYVKVGEVIGQSAVTSVTGTSLVVPIEMLDQPYVYSQSASHAIEQSKIEIDPSPYKASESYSAFFEVLGSNYDGGASRSVNLKTLGGTIATVSLNSGTSSAAYLYRVAIPGFDWSAPQSYWVEIGAGDTYITKVFSARVVIHQLNAVRTRLYHPMVGCENLSNNSILTANNLHVGVDAAAANTLFPIICLASGPTARRADSVLNLDPAKNIGLAHTPFTLDANLYVPSGVTANLKVTGGGTTLGTLRQAGLVSPVWIPGSSTPFSATLGSNYSLSLSIEETTSAQNIFVGRAGIWVDFDRLQRAQVFYRLNPGFFSTTTSSSTVAGGFLRYIPWTTLGSILGFGVYGTVYSSNPSNAVELTYGASGAVVLSLLGASIGISASSPGSISSSITVTATGGLSMSAPTYLINSTGSSTQMMSDLMSGSSFVLPNTRYQSPAAGTDSVFVNTGIVIEVGSH